VVAGTISGMHPQSVVDEARRRYAAGLTAADVARRMGLPWGTVAHWCRGDRRRVGVERIACPRCTSAPLNEERYAYLLGQYLGDGHITTGRRNVHCLSIFCADAWPGVRDEVEAALAVVLPASKVSMVQRIGCAQVKSYSTHWTCLFPQHGREESTLDVLPSSNGRSRSSMVIPARSSAGSSTPTAAGSPIGPADGSPTR
jgi:hypothetical protein